MSTVYLAEQPALRAFIAQREALAVYPEGDAYPRIPDSVLATLPEHARVDYRQQPVSHLLLIDWRHDSEDRGPAHAFVLECGRHRTGEGAVFCQPDLARMQRQYPQGWNTYPGDICRHGVYVGGCGRDLMCGRCELGDDE